MSQLKKSCEIIYRALADGTRMRDAWRESMWHLCCTELQRFSFTFLRDVWRERMSHLCCTEQFLYMDVYVHTHTHTHTNRFHKWESALKEETVLLREHHVQIEEERALLASYHQANLNPNLSTMP